MSSLLTAMTHVGGRRQLLTRALQKARTNRNRLKHNKNLFEIFFFFLCFFSFWFCFLSFFTCPGCHPAPCDSSASKRSFSPPPASRGSAEEAAPTKLDDDDKESAPTFLDVGASNFRRICFTGTRFTIKLVPAGTICDSATSSCVCKTATKNVRGKVSNFFFFFFFFFKPARSRAANQSWDPCPACIWW
jgi:hypothetical protein